ncbi:MAG: 50S ribosomal protein L15 [Methylacidiphilales bacterium]|nr:50S ribosomal protein L15 [Candidatus Methylacidiphilales bacterium]
MKLNQFSPAPNSKKSKHRVGRGKGCGWGKTSGRGHKGQHARAGGYHKIGFEGGQMPLVRRLPKFGFTSLIKPFRAELTLARLNTLDNSEITIDFLKQTGIISSKVEKVKIIATGTLSKSFSVVGVSVSKKARQLIEQAGGKVVN